MSNQDLYLITVPRLLVVNMIKYNASNFPRIENRSVYCVRKSDLLNNSGFTLLLLNPGISTFENCVDPEQLAPEEAI